MAILQIDEVRRHCRVEDDYPTDQLAPYMEAAESYVMAHLNRNVYVDRTALDDAQDAVGQVMTDAYATYQSDMNEAKQAADASTRQALTELARTRFESVQSDVRRTINGIVVNGAIRSAMLLEVGELFANRESSVVGASVAPLPQGAIELLRPFRLVQMP